MKSAIFYQLAFIVALLSFFRITSSLNLKDDGLTIHSTGSIVNHEVDDDIRKICETVKSQAISSINQEVTKFEPVSASVQVVAGAMYRIKVDVGNNNYYIIKVWERRWLNKVELMSVVKA
ncbi:hypothetical protein WA158_001953 [Blastocystis sp. Blastoise]